MDPVSVGMMGRVSVLGYHTYKPRASMFPVRSLAAFAPKPDPDDAHATPDGDHLREAWGTKVRPVMLCRLSVDAT
jgi:hypothetical protein